MSQALLGGDGRRNLCYKASLKPHAQAFVHDRYQLFDQIYTCAAVRAAECMVVDVMKAANHVIQVQDKLERWVDWGEEGGRRGKRAGGIQREG